MPPSVRRVLPVGSITSDATAAMGFAATSIAVFGFIGQAWPALNHRHDKEVRAAAVAGGLIGLVTVATVVAIDLVPW